MGLFTSFFSFISPEKPSGKPDIFVLIGSTKYEGQVMGDAQHQAALESICGRRVQRGVRRFETVWLVPEQKTLRDKYKVRVEIRGRAVGYLRPQDAMRYRQDLSAKGMLNAIGECQAMITGGWVSSDGRKGNYEVWVDLPSAYR
jgi:hypothetical protein